MAEKSHDDPSESAESDPKATAGSAPTEPAVAPPGDGETPPANAQPAGPPITVNAQYIKDLSFEAPTAPGVFALMQKDEPRLNVNIDVSAKPLQGQIYEVILRVQADCKVADTTAFIVELAYGGMFNINVPGEHLQPILLIECPRLLFPYVRQIISDATRDGGFPPLLLSPVDFVAMYQDQLKRREDAQRSETAGQLGARAESD